MCALGGAISTSRTVRLVAKRRPGPWVSGSPLVRLRGSGHEVSGVVDVGRLHMGRHAGQLNICAVGPCLRAADVHCTGPRRNVQSADPRGDVGGAGDGCEDWAAGGACWAWVDAVGQGVRFWVGVVFLWGRDGDAEARLVRGDAPVFLKENMIVVFKVSWHVRI